MLPGVGIAAVNILCLPDFVGHPLCYSALAKQLKGQATLHMPNYSLWWPYESVEALAGKIIEAMNPADYDLLLGYSFGAHVAAHCASRSNVRRLCLIDPPPLASLQDLTLEGIRQRLAADSRYAYIQDLVDAELVDPDCVHGNILLLSRLDDLPSFDAATDLLLSTASSMTAVKADFPRARGCWLDDQCDHATIIASRHLAPLILQDH